MVTRTREVVPSPWPNVARQLLVTGALEMDPRGISICAKVINMKNPTQSQVNALHAIAGSINVTIEDENKY